jgi:hypothetical protein
MNRVNKLLADGLGALNALLAVALIGIGALVGYVYGNAEVGAFVGGVAAVMFCGALAVFIDMRHELIAIHKAHNDGTAALSKQLGAIHRLLAEPPIPVFASSPPSGTGYCPGCRKLRGLTVAKCVYCGNTEPTADADPLSWRERLDRLAPDQSVTIGDRVVWKLKSWDGRVYFSGERTFASVDDVMAHYKL